MKLNVKTLKGSHFEIKVQPSDTIMAVKKNIEDIQGKDNYPCGQQLLIHNGKVLKDESTLVDNKVSEDGFLVVMLSKSKTLGASASSSTQPGLTAQPQSTITPAPETPAETKIPESSADVVSKAATSKYELHLFHHLNYQTSILNLTSSWKVRRPLSNQSQFLVDNVFNHSSSDTYTHAASNLVASSNLEQTIQQIIDMGGGNWDKETVTRALRAAYNNPERAVDYLYSGIPETTEVAVPVPHFPTSQVALEGTGMGTVSNASSIGAPNSSPLNLFPQEAISGGGNDGLGSLVFLRSNQQFQALRTMVQSNPQILQPMLQELGKQNPQLLRLIQEHHTEFLQLLNEPSDVSEGDMLDHADQEMPHSISVTPAEQEAIARLEAMGFDRAIVIEAFLACDRNEELAVNYLLEQTEDYED
ncbi:ubiquitin receptor RAD23b-like [Impatiens glandulifera]|uniref:ubiquitin receptor RAD23b-like n=1 Tax=Impatiens glandulifera TaxID=253017 RepID=UPI001FB15D57|nr:ubiquitin receptor RAD23b-like [Impatiens glandulifera]